MKRWVFFIMAVLYVLLILFVNRTAFASRFDPMYWKDRYEHSQWQLPVSSRTIGDDGLYLYAGYRLIQSDNPASINAEMPPAGKYLIGLSIATLGNGYWFAFSTNLAVLGMFFLLAKKLFKNNLLAATATALLASDPLFISQWSVTMLDSVQLLFLLAVFLLLFSDASPVFIGIAFGLFAGVKTPFLYGPILAAIVIVFLKKPKSVFLFLATAALTYALSYFRFFTLSHTIADWVALQKWMVGFYRNSLLTPTFGSALTTILTGRMQNLFSHTWESSGIWSPVWPIAAIFSILVIAKRNTLSAWLPVIAFTGIYFFIQNGIPFWTRYLILLLPFLYLLSVQALSKVNKIMFIGIIAVFILINFIGSANSLFPTPEATVADFTYSWEHGFFQDMYEHLSLSSEITDRQSFHRFGLQTYYDGEIEAATVRAEQPTWSRWKSPQTVKLTITYFTRELGPFTEHRTIIVIKENGAWSVHWQWNDLMDGFDQSKHLETTVVPAIRGSIIDKIGNIIAADKPGLMAWIAPNKVDQTKENEMLSALETAFHRLPGAAEIHERYVGNALPDRPTPIGVVASLVGTYPGLTYTPHFARTSRLGIANTQFKECCSYLYSTTTYHGIFGLEERYNEILTGKNGGTLVIKDAGESITRTIVDETKSDGRNVKL